MSSNIYIGGENNLRFNVKDIYVGVDNVVKKVRQAYIGVGGKPVPVYTTEVIHLPDSVSSYYGFYESKGCSLGNVGMFSGGSSNIVESFVWIVDSKLTYKYTNMIYPRMKHAAAKVGNYVLFAGGENGSGSIISTVDIINSEGTALTPMYLYTARRQLAGASINSTHALFGGGKPSSGYSSVVDVFNNELTWSDVELSQGRCDLAGCNISNYAYFAGGYNNGNRFDTVDCFDKNLSRTNTTTLVSARYSLSSATVGGHAVFAGGQPDSDVIDVFYRKSKVQVTSKLSQARAELAGAGANDFGIFAGGTVDITTDSSVVESIDKDFTVRTIYSDSSPGVIKGWSVGTRAGNYILIMSAYQKGIQAFLT